MKETSGCKLEAVIKVPNGTGVTMREAYLPPGKWKSEAPARQNQSEKLAGGDNRNGAISLSACGAGAGGAASATAAEKDEEDEDEDEIYGSEYHKRESIQYITGNYAQHLKAYLKFFRRDQFMIFNSNTAFKSPKKVMDAISVFLQVSPIPSWSGPFPHEDHTESISHLNCINKYTPELDCGFRDLMATYYRQLNGELYKLLNETKGAAHPAEPTFEPFDDPIITVPCVPDARKNLNILLEQRKSKKKGKHNDNCT